MIVVRSTPIYPYLTKFRSNNPLINFLCKFAENGVDMFGQRMIVVRSAYLEPIHPYLTKFRSNNPLINFLCKFAENGVDMFGQRMIVVCSAYLERPVYTKSCRE
jgi:hypothetical protein